MSFDFRMPDIGEGIAEVEIVEWRVGVGDEVNEYDTLAVIETDKSIVEMPSPVTGRVMRLGAKPGDMLAVGEVLIVFDVGDGQVVAGVAASGVVAPAGPAVSGVAGLGGNGSPAPPAAGSGRETPAPVLAPLRPPPSRPKASPAVRRLALEAGVDLDLVPGSGPGGRITREDIVYSTAGGGGTEVEATRRRRTPEGVAGVEDDPGVPGAQPPSVTGGPGGADLEDEHVPLRGLRRQIAKKMSESWRSVPHIIDWREADATQLIEARRVLRSHLPEFSHALSFVPLFVKVTAVALRAHPLLNASFDEANEEYVLHRRINIGIATVARDGLLVPVVADADRKTIAELAVEIAELVALARERKATREQLSGGTYTVNNLGAIGGQMGTPIIRTPEVGILGFGRISDRVVAVEGMAVVRPTIVLSSVGDHRLHDGDTLGAFTSAVVELIEKPYALLGHLR